MAELKGEEKRVRQEVFMIRCYCECGGEITSHNKRWFMDGDSSFYNECDICGTKDNNPRTRYPYHEYRDEPVKVLR